MKNGFFSRKLQEYIKSSGVSRDYIIEEPSLYKQYTVCIALGIDLFEYIIELDPLTCLEGKKDKDTIENYTRYLNGSFNLLRFD